MPLKKRGKRVQPYIKQIDKISKRKKVIKIFQFPVMVRFSLQFAENIYKLSIINIQ